MLFCMLLLLMSLALVLSQVAVAILQGISISEATDVLADPLSENGQPAARLSNVLFQLVAFLGAAWLFRGIYGKQSVAGFLLRPNPTPTGLTWMVWMLPLALGVLYMADFTTWLNYSLIPPDSSLGEWAMQADELANRQYEALLGGGKVPLWQLVMMSAVLPALCEEFFFRGVLQIQLAKATRNVHVAIWVTALLFALTHMQVYGMLPRLFMGALLGYTLIWSGTIWAPVLLHMLYNGSALAIYVYFESVGSEEGMALAEQGPNNATDNWLGWVLGVAISGFVIWGMLRRSAWPTLRERYLRFEKQDVDAYLSDRYGN